MVLVPPALIVPGLATQLMVGGSNRFTIKVAVQAACWGGITRRQSRVGLVSFTSAFTV